MKNNVKRRFSAWLLLLVFVPVMVATSLHIHDYEGANEAACELCAHHVHHGGHLNSYSDHVFDCPFCEFISLPFVAPTVVAIALTPIIINVVYADREYCLSLGVCDIKSTRAPPFKSLVFSC